ncbi:MAG: hypothetical protein ACRDHF_19210, partial [Tepidiformaceae bacterium]
MRSLFILAGGAAVALAVAGCTEQGMTERTINAPLPSAASNSRPPFVFPSGCCYYEGRVVRTVVPPASTPQAGRD